MPPARWRRPISRRHDGRRPRSPTAATASVRCRSGSRRASRSRPRRLRRLSSRSSAICTVPDPRGGDGGDGGEAERGRRCLVPPPPPICWTRSSRPLSRRSRSRALPAATGAHPALSLLVGTPPAGPAAEEEGGQRRGGRFFQRRLDAWLRSGGRLPSGKGSNMLLPAPPSRPPPPRRCRRRRRPRRRRGCHCTDATARGARRARAYVYDRAPRAAPSLCATAAGSPARSCRRARRRRCATRGWRAR